MSTDPDHELQGIEQRLVELSHRVDLDTDHQARLRAELVRRGRERANVPREQPWYRSFLSKRLALLAPAALAATAAAVLLSVLQISGPRHAQPVLADQITRALTHTVPTVTSWKVTLRQYRPHSPSVYQCRVPLTPKERLYLRDGRIYLWSGKQWYVVTLHPSSGPCPADWQWAFADLPARLARHHVTVAPGPRVAGQATQKISYVSRKAQGTVAVTIFVARQTGLLLHMERVTQQAGKVIEHDRADYSYSYR